MVTAFEYKRYFKKIRIHSGPAETLKSKYSLNIMLYEVRINEDVYDHLANNENKKHIINGFNDLS